MSNFTTWRSLVDGEEILAIPDSAIFHWPFAEGSGSTLSEELDGQDGAINGPTWTSGSWWDDYALSGDGTDDYVETTTWGGFWEDYANDEFTVLFTFETTDDFASLIGGRADGGNNNQRFMLNTGDVGEGSAPVSGKLNFQWAGDESSGADYSVVHTEEDVTDGTRYRAALVVDNDSGRVNADAVSFALNGSFVEDVTEQDEANEEFEDIMGNPILFFAHSDEGGDDAAHIDAEIDNIIVTNEGLSESEIQDDYDAQPWT